MKPTKKMNFKIMKTFKNQIKSIILLMVLVVSTNTFAQNEIKKSGLFVRVFNLDGKKIHKGHVTFASDTLLGLKKNGNYIEINVKEIGTIKTKRSAGHNILMGSIIGGASMAILGAASADPNDWILGYTAAEGATAGALLGGTTGAAIGGITIAFKNTTTFVINGDYSNLKSFKQMLNQ